MKKIAQILPILILSSTSILAQVSFKNTVINSINNSKFIANNIQADFSYNIILMQELLKNQSTTKYIHKNKSSVVKVRKFEFTNSLEFKY